MAIHLTPEANPTVQEGTLYVDSATGEFNVAGRTTPHIIPGVLYPAVAGNDLSGTALGGSYVYGTAHTDGRKYYYTDIKGSKPIKDPRVGGHFGSQRHKFKSLQLLEQETATEGVEVYSVDGREWIRARGDVWTAPYNTAGGFLEPSDRLKATDSQFIEIVGYFNDANILHWSSSTTHDQFGVAVNGGTRQNNDLNVSVASPLGLNRYVDVGSVLNLYFHSSFSGSLGINTLRISNTTSAYLSVFGIELIAQDTTSTANRSKIQIPSQNVVSYGKKFNVSAEGSSGHHYDPFNGFTSGSSVTSYIDTATSLGVENWKNSSTYYRPYNGGRVVKWVDSSGVIKTSVTLMPPNAQNIGGTAINAKANASVANDTYSPTFSGAIDDSLSESSKTFIIEEFGNGSANGGTGGTYADASMLSGSSDSIAYVMDDGLTSLSANDVTKGTHASTGGYLNTGSGDDVYTTFIGTGVTLGITNWNGDGKYIEKVAFNLPYGTHILKVSHQGSNVVKYIIDGVEVKSVTASVWGPIDFSFHQPKKPPIPEDACVIADYMLMADFVPITSQNSNLICKGVRRQNSSRDIFYDKTDGDSFSFHTSTQPEGFGVEIGGSGADNATSFKARIPSFGTNIVHRGYASVSRAQIYVDSTPQTTTDDSTTNNYGSYQYIATDKTLGVYNWGTNAVTGTNGNITSFEIATPIHTSHHYQSFESPYLHELIGGDRNMEQTNLVCSPDGKSWDEVTRDKSYLGSNLVLSATTDTATGWSTTIVFDEWRGTGKNKARFNKDSWAIAYDRLICLKDGTYEMLTSGSFDSHQDIYLNGTDSLLGANASHSGITLIIHMKRGEYIQVKGDFGMSDDIRYGHFFIKRVN